MASSHTNQCQHYYTLEIHYLRLLGIECFHPSWNIQLSYLFAIPALVPLVLPMFLAEHVTGQFRLLILVVPCCDGLSDVFPYSNHSSFLSSIMFLCQRGEGC